MTGPGPWFVMLSTAKTITAPVRLARSTAAAATNLRCGIMWNRRAISRLVSVTACLLPRPRMGRQPALFTSVRGASDRSLCRGREIHGLHDSLDRHPGLADRRLQYLQRGR